MIGKIQRVPLREVWKHEAHVFARWLEENIDAGFRTHAYAAPY